MYFLNITRSWGGVAFLKREKKTFPTILKLRCLEFYFSIKPFILNLKNLI